MGQGEGVALSFSVLAGAIRRIWAKSGEGFGHGLLAHMLDVAAVVETILAREPESSRCWIARELGLPPAQVVRWIAFLIGLHDFGKSIPGFQLKWLEGWQCLQLLGLVADKFSAAMTQHAPASAALLNPLLGQREVADAAWLRHVLQAISAHHGYNFTQSQINEARPVKEGRGWSEVRQGLFDAYFAFLAPQGVPNVEELSLPAVQWLAGLTSVSDWIGSNPDWFPLGERRDDLGDYYADALRRAATALDAVEWPRYRTLLPEPLPLDTLIGRIIGRQGVAARPLQQRAEQLLAGGRGPSLLLVEAPMGEGKTELAFLAHLYLQAANQHRGLYVAMPTQATGNALFQRAVTFLRSFAADAPLDVQLVHGGAALNEQIAHLRGIAGTPGEDVTSSSWFSQRRRPLLSPYGVGTVDQALFAALNVKHHFVRLWGLGNRVVILDEVHAYDLYTGTLIEQLLRWLKAMGSSVVLMSATLPAARRNALLRAWGIGESAIPAQPYPRLMLADDRGISGASCESRPLAPIELRAVGEDLASLAACALTNLESEGCGAIIVNTVDRAQALYRMLQSSVDDSTVLMLFHARFPADQRGEIETAVLKAFGPQGTRPQRALLIATQVAEQSLDFDADVMLTDLAPVDLLLQRAGRLHRHQRARPKDHCVARLYVAGLGAAQLPDLRTTAWEFVYSPYILGRTWAFLRGEAELHFPRDIDRLVQTVYGDVPLPDEVPEAARQYIDGKASEDHQGKQQAMRQLATHVAIDPADEPQSAYLNKHFGFEEGEEGIGLPNRTRLGGDSVTLVPVHDTPEGWRVMMDGEVFDPRQPVTDALAKALYARQIKTSRPDLVRHFQAADNPEAFAGHPLLRHLKPLRLVDGNVQIGKLTVCLDDELGLIYQRNAPASEDEK
ncbi:CRISPR-associated helicase/endonuclease Cas3 [Chitiniphilus shinanonensis]